MHYGNIKNCDIANGAGVRVTLFVSGCRNHCPGCFQRETWDFSYGTPFDDAAREQIINMLAPDYIRGLTLLGGEPFEISNQQALLPFVKRVRQIYPDKDIWAYSGFTLEELLDDKARCHCPETLPLLKLIDVLVDGKFEADKYDISLRFRGSSNQRIIDLPATLKKGEVVPWNG
ncbi:MAG: anaerobic ribonucleoside-triphosphate reductase activating protein [Clostridia bacterium]|nr:anaerobic ribonucleoside-triphosphate reductase activating protein [Clostridia bacterium]